MAGGLQNGKGGVGAVPPTVWALGCVSLLMDTSSEMIHGLLPVFLVGTLGASVAMVGWIEGLGEATAAVLKVFSGWLSDRLGRRKLLAVAGYGLAAVSKPLFPLASGPATVLVARLADRIGKGIRGAPRDALVADITPPQALGAAFGLRQALDTVGAFLGPLAAIGLTALYVGDVRAVFWWALLPAAAAVAVLVVAVREPAPKPGAAARAPLSWREAARLGWPFWAITGFGVVFTLARFSEAFLILRAQERGLPLVLAPVVLVVMNLVYALSAAPAGSLSDRIDGRGVLAASLAVLVGADAALAWSGSVAVALVGAALWGLHMGMSQGLLAALVAGAAPAQLRGTAFGLFNLATGAALLAASVIAGWLWETFGPSVTFQAGGAFALLATLALVLHMRVRPRETG